MSNKDIEYKGGRIKPLVELVAKIVKNNPTIDNDHLHATLVASLPGYGDRKVCYNCERSMQLAVYTAGLFEGLLLLRMAQSVKKQMELGVPFTEANKIHVPTLETTDAIRHAITRASYLGLVAQPQDMRNSGYWVITSWGWAALRGAEVPKKAKWWEGQLMGRSEETTTLSQMFQTHVDLVEKQIALRKSVKGDYRDDVKSYSPRDWLEYGESVSAPNTF